MIRKYKFINNIDNIAEEKLTELGLKAERKLAGFIEKNKRFYSTACRGQEEKVFFKLLITDEIAPREAILREIEIRKFLENYKERINFPPLINYDNQNFPYWFISHYSEGGLLGHFYEIYSEDKKHIPRLAEQLFGIQDIPEEKTQELKKNKRAYLWERRFEDYLKMVKSYKEDIDERLIKDIDFGKIHRLFEEKRIVLEETPLVISHGDFTLANFVVGKEEIVITDWEQAHLDSFAYDISHLWIQTWRYGEWRRTLLQTFISKLKESEIETFKQSFRLIIITEALGELNFSIKLCEKEYVEGAIKAAGAAIESALEGFNSLTGL